MSAHVLSTEHIFQSIASRLPASKLALAAMCCRVWQRIIYEDDAALWQAHVFSYFQVDEAVEQGEAPWGGAVSWMHAYRDEVTAKTSIRCDPVRMHRGARDDFDIHCKFVVGGAYGSGKTHVIKRWREDTFDDIFWYASDVTTTHESYDGVCVKLDIWDTGGYERFANDDNLPMLPAWYRGANGVFIMYDITQRGTFEDVPRWFRRAFQHMPKGCHLHLVGCKSDLTAARQVTYADGAAMAQRFSRELSEWEAQNHHPTSIGRPEVSARYNPSGTFGGRDVPPPRDHEAQNCLGDDTAINVSFTECSAMTGHGIRRAIDKGLRGLLCQARRQAAKEPLPRGATQCAVC